MKTHMLKSWPEEFRKVRDGLKRHEVRTFDRDFKMGDHIILQEWDPVEKQVTGYIQEVVITDITRPGTFSLPAHLGVLSIDKV